MKIAVGKARVGKIQVNRISCNIKEVQQNLKATKFAFLAAY